MPGEECLAPWRLGDRTTKLGAIEFRSVFRVVDGLRPYDDRERLLSISESYRQMTIYLVGLQSTNKDTVVSTQGDSQGYK